LYWPLAAKRAESLRRKRHSKMDGKESGNDATKIGNLGKET